MNAPIPSTDQPASPDQGKGTELAAPAIALLAGLLFGAGLTLGGMTNPARVRGFLDIFGQWDPTLAFVMGGAVIVMAIAWRVQATMVRPLFALSFIVPTGRDITARLLIGSALFGIGWAIAGLCPGPAIASLVIAPMQAAIFIAFMALGMGLASLIESHLDRSQG